MAQQDAALLTIEDEIANVKRDYSKNAQRLDELEAELRALQNVGVLDKQQQKQQANLQQRYTSLVDLLASYQKRLLLLEEEKKNKTKEKPGVAASQRS